MQTAAGERRSRALPLALAVVPAGAGTALAARLRNLPQVAVLQHGWAHANHAPPDRKTIELGPDRPVRTVMRELEAGRDRLRGLFRNRFLPVVVPPWNRIAPDIARALPRHGFSGLSTAGPRRGARISGVAGYRVANVHIDIFQWRPRARFIGTEAALAQAIGHLAARRQRLVDIDEPTGLMTHHRQHDAACWRFIDRFLSETARHPAVRWLSADGIFPATRGAGRNRRRQGQS